MCPIAFQKLASGRLRRLGFTADREVTQQQHDRGERKGRSADDIIDDLQMVVKRYRHHGQNQQHDRGPDREAPLCRRPQLRELAEIGVDLPLDLGERLAAEGALPQLVAAQAYLPQRGVVLVAARAQYGAPGVQTVQRLLALLFAAVGDGGLQRGALGACALQPLLQQGHIALRAVHLIEQQL